MSESKIERFLRRHPSIEPVQGDPNRTLKQIVAACDAAKDDPDELCLIGVVFVEPLVDTHWRDIDKQFAEAMRSNRLLRMAFSCADIDIPDEVANRYNGLMRPGEDIGRGSETE